MPIREHKDANLQACYGPPWWVHGLQRQSLNKIDVTSSCHRKRAAFGAPGFLWHLFLNRSSTMGEFSDGLETLARHLNEAQGADNDFFLFLANNFDSECIRLKRFFTDGFVIVFQGNFPFKTLEGGRSSWDFHQGRLQEVCVCLRAHEAIISALLRRSQHSSQDWLRRTTVEPDCAGLL